ncbi:SDR family oxidoreductase [Reinekea thalattae]|nr:SDR family oxidoreductase [Reinekea thalattae]
MNNVAVITGAGRGIGAETAKLFAEKGYAVVINYIHNREAAEQTAQQVRDIGAECLVVQADVANAEQVDALFQQADQLGTLSVLVNNAGILNQQCRIEDISEQRFLTILQTNVMSCFLCTQQAIKRMSTKHGGKGGTIVNVSSGAAKTGSPNEYVDYAASKGAMDSFTRGAALELADEGIRVNSVRPGLIYTEMHASGGEPGRVDRLKELLPLKRGGQAREVAEAIYWLASDKSTYVTGSFIDATGGR